MQQLLWVLAPLYLLIHNYEEFGVASINIICMFIISICLVPIIFSYLPEPKGKHAEHLDRQWMFKVLDTLVYFATQKRKQVYLVTQLYSLLVFMVCL